MTRSECDGILRRSHDHGTATRANEWHDLQGTGHARSSNVARPIGCRPRACGLDDIITNNISFIHC